MEKMFQDQFGETRKRKSSDTEKQRENTKTPP